MDKLVASDLMLINRGGKTHTITMDEVNESVNPASVLKPQIINPSADAAVDPNDIPIQSTDFACTPPGALTHGKSEWWIAEKSDLNYTGAGVIKNDSSSDLTEYKVTLEEDKEYRVKVKHKATDGKESEWSDDATFATKSPQVPTAKPGDVYRLSASEPDKLIPCNVPVKVVNLAVGSYRANSGAYAIGVDGKMYSCINGSNDFTDTGRTGVLSAAATTELHVINGNHSGYVTDDGIAHFNVDGTFYDTPFPVKMMGTFGTYNEVAYCINEEGTELYAIGRSGRLVITTTMNGSSWVKLTLMDMIRQPIQKELKTLPAMVELVTVLNRC